MLSAHGATIASAYGLGSPAREMIMVARGEQGRIWRLDTDTGAFAIKELVVRQMGADAVADVAYQEALLETGRVRMPRPIRTADGQVLVDVADHQVRAYEWVDVLSMDPNLDPQPGRRDVGCHSSSALRAGASAHWLVHRSGWRTAMD